MSHIRLLIVAVLILTGSTLFVDREEAVSSAITTARAEDIQPMVNEEPRTLKEFANKIYELKACEESGCERNVPHEIGLALRAMTWWVAKNRIEDRVVNNIAQEFVIHHHPWIQEAALGLMATQPPDRGNLRSILEGIDISGQDPDLIELALKELERYKNYGDLTIIHQSLAETILSGAPIVGREVSARLVPFITAWSIPYFKRIMAALPIDSVNRDNLEAAISVVQ